VERKRCIIDDEKYCDECGQCQICDLDPNKTCDNCMKCIHTGAACNAIEIDEILETEDTDGYTDDELGQVWRIDQSKNSSLDQ